MYLLWKSWFEMNLIENILFYIIHFINASIQKFH